MTEVKYDYTYALSKKFIKEIEKIVFGAELGLNVIFAFYYLYMALSHHHSPVSITLYIIMTVINLTTFVIDVVFSLVFSIRKAIYNLPNRIMSMIKYFLRWSVIIFTIVTLIVSNDDSNIEWTLTIVSVFLLVAQFIGTFVLIFSIKYLMLLTEALKMDLKSNDDLKDKLEGVMNIEIGAKKPTEKQKERRSFLKLLKKTYKVQKPKKKKTKKIEEVIE